MPSNSPIIEQLRQWGPDGKGPSLPLVEARGYCRQLALGHYENFPVVTWFLPRDEQPHFFAIYAYCRWADDLADEVAEPAESLRLLDWWESEFRRCHARACGKSASDD